MKNALKKNLFVFACAAMLMFAVSGCGTSETAQTASQSSISTSQSDTRTITDMSNRKNTILTDVTRISVVHPIPCQMVWRLAPDKLASVDKQFTERLEFMSSDEQKRLQALPVTGEFHSGLSAEEILAANPEVVISLTKDTNIDEEQKSFNVPVLAASKDTLQDLAESWRFIGKVVGNEKEGNELGDYWEKTVQMVTDQTDRIAQDKKLKVYYAQSDVTNTVGTKTIMASIIRLAGGINLMDTYSTKTSSEETNESIQVSMEQILQWNPDIIITKTSKGRDQILSDDAWKDIAAVQNNRVYTSTKYEMLDRTQSLMGLLWTAKKLYPEKVTFDLNKEVKNFYSKVYLDNNVTDDQINQTNSD